MIARRSFLTLAATLGASLGLSGCSTVRFSYRYCLSIEVDTPEGLRSGSGVLEVRAFDSKGLDGGRGGAGTTGEAVVVDLGPRGTLFALLKRESRRDSFSDEFSADVALRARKVERGHGDYVPFARKVAAISGVIEVLPEEQPMLVRFRDIDDPATVEKVDPNNLAKSFGAGVRLKRATIEMTSDPVTTGIETRLGWLGQYYDKQLDGRRFETIEATNRFANSMSTGVFKTWRD